MIDRGTPLKMTIPTNDVAGAFELGRLDPFDDVYNALLGNGEVDLCAKYAVLGAIHDHACADEEERIVKPDGDFAEQQRDLYRLVEAAILSRPAIVKGVLDRWLAEIKVDLELMEIKKPGR